MGTNSGRNCFHIRRLGGLYRQLFVEGDRSFPHMMVQLNSWAVIDWQYMSAVKQWHQKQFHENFTSAFSLWLDVASDRLWFQGKTRTTAQFPLPLFFCFFRLRFLLRGGDGLLLRAICLHFNSKPLNTRWFYLDPLRGIRGTYSDPGSVTEGNQTAGQKLCQLRPRRTVGEAFFPLNLAIQLYFRVNSDFINKSLNALQAVPRLASCTEAGPLLSPPNTRRDMPGIPRRDIL